MDILAIIRRSISAAVATALLLVGCAYLVVSTTLLTTAGLKNISQQAKLTEIIRSDLVLPHLITQAENSSYSHLINQSAVTKAFNQAVPSSALEPKLDPAIEATRAWLDSKSSDISFVIDTSDQAEDFKSALIKQVNQNVAKLPACTYDNTLSEAQYGICKSPYISSLDIQTEIADSIDSNPSLQLSKISSDSFAIPDSSLKLTRNLPDYINMLYALSLLTSGIAAIICLRLILRHKLNGLITLGFICLALSLIIFIVSLLITPLVTSWELPGFTQSLASATAESFKAQMQRQSIALGGIGVIIVVVLSLIKLAVSRWRSSRHS